MAQYLNDLTLWGGPFAGIERKPFEFENYTPPAKPAEQPFDWGGLWDSVQNFDPVQHHLETALKTGMYMQPENYGERMYDFFDVSMEPYMSDEERAALPLRDPRRDAISSLAVGAAEVAAPFAMKVAPKLADESLRMMTFGEIGGQDILGHTPQFINNLNRRLGLPEMPFEMPVTGYHYGRKKGLTELDPAFHGEGAMGRERQYSQFMDDELKPTYFYLDEGQGVKPENVVLSGASSVYKADLPDDLMYDMMSDPEGLWMAAKEQVRLPSGVTPQSEAMPLFLRSLKDKGYKGYIGHNPNIPDQGVAAVLGKTPVEELPAGTGMSRQGIYPDPNEGYNVLAGENVIKMVQPKRAKEAGEEIVWIDMDKLDESWRQDKGFYLPLSGGNRIGTRYEDLRAKLPDLKDLDMPEAGFSDTGIFSFTDGRHRTALLRDKGASRIPVSMTKDDAKLARDMGFEAPQDKWYRGTMDPNETYTDTSRGAGHWTRERDVAGEYYDKIIEAGISVKNPIIINDSDWRMLRDKPELMASLKRRGHDAAISDDTGDIIPFRAEQISKYDADLLGDIPPAPTLSALRGTGSSGGVGKAKHRVGTTGQYVGAPEGVNTPQALGRLRKNYTEAAKLGAAGRNWYGDSSEWIQGVTPDTIRGKEIADVLGITSQGTGVDVNLGFTVKGTVQDALGMPIDTGRFKNTQSPLISEVFAGHNPDLGPKRTPFAENLTTNWNPFLHDRPVHDIWQGRAMGYKKKTGAPWDAGFSPQQHAFMDEQMDIITTRLNEMKAEGFADWDNLNTQAAAWTGAKIKAGDLSIDDAAMHFGSYSPKYQANATHEAVPGVGTGHLEGLAGMPMDRRANYSITNNWNDPRGRDALYSDVGLMVEPDDIAQGVYRPAGGDIEFNPAKVSHPLVNIITEGGTRRVSPEAATILDAVEGTRAYVSAQNAGAWHKLIAGNKAKSNSSLTIPLERKVTEDEMRALADLAERNGMFAVDTGRGVNLINDPYTVIGKARDGVKLGKEIKGDLGEQIKAVLPEGRDVQRVTAQTGYIDYLDAWRAGEGSGEATRILKGLFDGQPELLNRLDQSETLRRKATEKLQVDEKFAKANNLPVREDLQTARRIIAESGLKGLFRALDQGAALPAIALGLLPLLTEESAETAPLGETGI